MQKRNLKKIISILLILLTTSSCAQYCASNRALMKKITHENLDRVKCEVNLNWWDELFGKECK